MHISVVHRLGSGVERAGVGVRVLMLGWEFPPFISGGLGTACEGLTRAMAREGVQVLFVLPKSREPEDVVGSQARPAEKGRRGVQEESGACVQFRTVPSLALDPYQTGAQQVAGGGQDARQFRRAGGAGLLESQCLKVVGTGSAGGYEGDLIGRIAQYAARCIEMTADEDFDVIHAHDWVTFAAGMAIAARSGKPLVVHVHSTEFDRSGERVNQRVYEIERAGVHAASAVIAVSHLTKKIIVERYGVSPEKVRVVHNGVEPSLAESSQGLQGNGEKTVLFLGRITMQKGPEYFVRAAARVLERFEKVKFVVAGWGDLGPTTVEQVAAMGLGRKVRFTGFLRGREVQRAYRLADVFVMPSVSEPFGLTALEAVQNGVPVVVSKSSGVAEVLTRGALKVDFWDIDEMANKIIAVLRRREVAETLRRLAAEDIRELTWDRAAQQCVHVYGEQLRE